MDDVMSEFIFCSGPVAGLGTCKCSIVRGKRRGFFLLYSMVKGSFSFLLQKQ